MTALRSHQLRAEIDRLENIVYELDHGPCTESLIERVGDIGITLCELSSACFSDALMFPPDGGLTPASQGKSPKG